MTERLYWCGWNVPNNLSLENMVGTWPDSMRGFLTGENEMFTTWVGPVFSVSSKEAEKLIRSCYTREGHRISMRWVPLLKAEQEPIPDRFPSGNEFVRNYLNKK